MTLRYSPNRPTQYIVQVGPGGSLLIVSSGISEETFEKKVQTEVHQNLGADYDGQAATMQATGAYTISNKREKNR